jgi:hypothetical protein
MRHAGVTAQGDIDCLVAITAGLMEAQLARSAENAGSGTSTD